MTMALMGQGPLAPLVGVLSSLSAVYRSLTNGTADEPIILDGDDRSKDGDGDLDTQPGPRTLNNAPNLETPPVLPNRMANERDSDDDINNDWDDESDTPDPEAVTEPNKPTDPAGHGTWWDIEDGCYVDDDLHLIPPLEQEGLASTPAQYQPHSRHSSLGASQDQINLRNDNGARRSAFEEPAPHSLSPTFGEDNGGRMDGNVSELGTDSLLTLQPSTSQIDPEHDQGGPSHGGFKGPGHTTPLHSRGQEEDGPQERQQQEAALEPIENEDSENGDDGEQRREKRRHQEETEEISSGTHQSEDGAHTHNTNGQDDEGPRPAKRRRKLKHLATPVSDEQRDTSRDEGRTLSTFVESIFASTASTTPGAFEPAPPPEPQLAAQVIDANQDWEVRRIIGKEDIDGVLHYLVEWSPTLAPEHLLGHAKELVDEFEARLRAQRGAKNERGAGLKRGEQAVIEADASGGQQEKRRRGRPRKQT